MRSGSDKCCDLAVVCFRDKVQIPGTSSRSLSHPLPFLPSSSSIASRNTLHLPSPDRQTTPLCPLVTTTVHKALSFFILLQCQVLLLTTARSPSSSSSVDLVQARAPSVPCSSRPTTFVISLVRSPRSSLYLSIQLVGSRRSFTSRTDPPRL